MKKVFLLAGGIAVLGFISVLAILAHAGGVPLLFPSGSVALAERDLMVRTVLLMLIVVVPVYALIIAIGWRYRAANRKAKYTPNWEHSTLEEFIWWAIPFEIVLVLSAVTWTATHTLAPERPLAGTGEPLVVQVVALPWKWVFLYPEEGVASVGELALPAGRPVTFQITADAPMNSFWVPALGGQVYAMSGMVTELNLVADSPGEYAGMSSNYSGEGFSKMNFTVRALDDEGYRAWVETAKAADIALDEAAYRELRDPMSSGTVRYYSALPFSFMAIVHASMGMDISSSSAPAPDSHDMHVTGMH